MKYFIDTADLTEIEKWRYLLGDSFAGVTTNLNMLKGQEAIERFPYKPLYKTVMFQITDRNEASSILSKDASRENLIAKVSILENNFNLINHLKKSGLRMAATTCYDIIQINQAIEMGFEFSMVYYHKNPYKGLLYDAVKLKKDTGSDIKLVAASIRNYEEVKTAILSGIEYVTVKPSVLEKLFNNEDAIKEISNV